MKGLALAIAVLAGCGISYMVGQSHGFNAGLDAGLCNLYKDELHEASFYKEHGSPDLFKMSDLYRQVYDEKCGR